LNSLRAFEAAGRHLSFTRAAEELHVTPAAVGQQVRNLEQALDKPLMLRVNRSLTLTEAGHALLPGLSDVFYRMQQVVQDFRRRDSDRPLTVTVPPSFAGTWLVPRLTEFRRLYPDIEIRIDASNSVVDLLSEDVDLGIRYGSGDYTGLCADRLLDEAVFPVCSPALLEGEHPLLTPEDLRWHELLHVDDAVSTDFWPNWEVWLYSAGVGHLSTRKGMQFSDSAMALQMAVKGRGVALGSRVMSSSDLRAGRLVRPFQVNMPLELAYWLVCPAAIAETPRVAAFRDWVMSEARADQPEVA
jgi:LysR family glycine cleavage system transcriptional activator